MIVREYFLMFVSFVTLFIALFWIQIFLFRDKEQKEIVRKDYRVSIIVPVHNEEFTIKDTLESLININYPKDKIEIIVVNDGSTDRTEEIVEGYKNLGVKLINKSKSGKAAAVNTGLSLVNSEVFGIVDADSIVDAMSVSNMLHFFDSEKTGAVISLIKVKNPRNIFEKLQHLEYIFSSFSRKLMSNVNTLFITPGVLTLYKTEIIKRLCGFDENNLTEDLEIAMKLRYNGYNIFIETNSVTYTAVPRTFNKLWNQRVRWFRGYLYNTKKYKDMFFSKKHGFLGLFQVPLNFITVFLVVLSFTLAFYEILRLIYEFIIKLVSYKMDIIYSFKIPSLKEIIFKMDLKIIFPILISFVLALYVYNKAHKAAREKWKFPMALLLYVTIYPSLRIAHWIAALGKEIMGAKKKW